VTVADAFDAMTSERPYRPSLTVERALAELRDGKGVQFDPEVVEAFVRAYPSAQQLPIATPAPRMLRLPENVVPACMSDTLMVGVAGIRGIVGKDMTPE